MLNHDSMQEEFTGERWIPGVEGDIRLEHMHRYRFALQFSEGKRVLDIACGEGYGSDLLASVAKQVTGVDINDRVVARARRRYVRENLKFVAGDCSLIPLADACVDVVISFETIEHHEKHDEMLSEIRRVLIPGGLLVMSSPDRYEYTDVLGNANEYHVKELYRHEFEDLISRHFKNQTIVGQRLVYGSAILGDQRQFVEMIDADDARVLTRGLARPIYFISIASDAPIPPIHAGILETPVYRSGGYQDVARQLSESDARASAQMIKVADLEREVATSLGELEAARSEQEDLRSEVQRLEASLHRSEDDVRSARSQLEILEGEYHRYQRSVERLSNDFALISGSQRKSLKALESAMSSAAVLAGLGSEGLMRDDASAFSGTRDEIPAALIESDPIARLEDAAGAIRAADLHEIVRRFELCLNELAVRIEQARAEAKQNREAYEAILRSRSWRITSPMRVAANLGRLILKQPSRAGSVAAAIVRRGWQRLPLGAQQRSRVHYLLRRRFPGIYYRIMAVPSQRSQSPEAFPVIEPNRRKLARQAGDGGFRETPCDGDGPLIPQVNDWRAYDEIIAFDAELRRARVSQADVSPVPILNFADRDLGEVLDELRFRVSENPEVSIIIPVFNQLRYTTECLASLAATLPDDTAYEIIIADDASTDHQTVLLSSVEGVRYERREANVGFLLNTSAAADAARGEILVFLNNDVQVRPGWLKPLLRAIRGDAAVGAAGPKFIYPDGRLQEAGAFILPDASSVMIGLFDDPDRPEYNRERQVDYCSGACLAVRRSYYFAVGGFSQDLAPAYCEDLELGLKLRNKGFKTIYCPESVVVHHLSVTTGITGQDAKIRQISANRQKVIERWIGDVQEINDVKVLAFYLPQFHPIPENDAWWGAGFTEWRNVARAKPNFEGHNQPRVPADLSYYDLRAVEVMDAQVEMAQRFGVHGFCFYYYWFGQKKLLEMPLERMLATGRPDIPFCLCWANENWTRRWDGRDQELLIGQTYSEEDDVRVIDDLGRFFAHRNYIRISGRPLVLVYRVDQFPNFSQTARRWRDRCRTIGIGEIYIAAVESFTQSGFAVPPTEYGCDAVVEFPPHNFGVVVDPPGEPRPSFTGVVYDYREMIDLYLQRPGVPYPRFRGVMPGWDNTARRQNSSHIFINNTPEAFQAWLEVVMRQTREHSHADERIVFVNAWNEWAEGAYLEPDSVYGYRWLESVWNAKQADLLNR
jgi:GT2 family glycosyltransferase/ubiquinone/menaquinone biosynthesis C-methylase UbiE